MNVLAVVMARGGSVGLPGKALKLLLGRPVLAYTLDHVRESRKVTACVVSSDDEAILECARREGFETIARPVELATASSATDPVLRHAVRVRMSQGHPMPDAVVMLYGNVPIRRPQMVQVNGTQVRMSMIDACIHLLEQTGCESVQTITSVGKMHPYWMFDRTDDGRIKKHIPNNVFRRQDLPPLYSPTGSVYVMRTKTLMESENSGDPHGMFGMDRRGLIVGGEDMIDIDSPKDLFAAEAMIRWMQPQAEEEKGERV